VYVWFVSILLFLAPWWGGIPYLAQHETYFYAWGLLGGREEV
jgi:hypothetical protein